MSRPRLLDLFCCAGGAAMGYHRAGFDVVGVDIKPQPRYPFPFIQGDAIEILTSMMDGWLYLASDGNWYGIDDFDAIHASPPCQGYANVTKWRGNQDNHPKLIAPVRELLKKAGKPWVMENVRTKELEAWLMLCGTMFGLRVMRHRYFEVPWMPPILLPPCHHINFLPFEHKAERAFADAMGCEWMDKVSAREAIPPAYTEFIGAQLMNVLQVQA